MGIVFCHLCKAPNDEVERSRARLIGSPDYGGLWHCVKHQDCLKCPHGSWTEKRLKVIKAIVILALLVASPALAEGREVYGYNVERLADSIYHAEGGDRTAYPYGILTKFKTTTPRQACINTIVNQGKRHAGHNCGKDYLTCLRDRYCPIGAENDPAGLNINWLRNVKGIYARS